jgi:ribonucleotide reductase alpha subunit
MLLANISKDYHVKNAISEIQNTIELHRHQNAKYISDYRSYNEFHYEKTKEFYEAIASGKISLATPILSNLRKKDGNLASCYIASIFDSWLDIAEGIKTIGLISKNGGGVGVNISRIRATGSYVNKVKGASSGVINWIKLINDTGVAVNQGGANRAGAVTVALDTWHLDIESFLDIQTENGDQRNKAYDIFPQVVISDLFMKRCENNEMWTLFDPYEIRTKYNKELCELWGDEFETFYFFLESEVKLSNIKLFNTISARELIKKIMKTTIETGMPYVFFKDTVNQVNPNKNEGMIGNGNLCVAGNTPILTKDGEIQIKDLVNTIQSIWNGEQWCDVVIDKTGENQELFEVVFESNFAGIIKTKTIQMTEYHKIPFWIESINSDMLTEKERADMTKTYLTGDNGKWLRVYRLNHLKDFDGINNELLPFYLPNSKEENFYQIKSVTKIDGLHDTYCFTEKNRSMGVFNGVLLGNCQESFSNFKPSIMKSANEVLEQGEIHVCSLASLNLSILLNLDDIRKYTKIEIEILDNIIDLTKSPIIEGDIHNNKYRIIGGGLMGYADHLAIKKIAYNNPKAVEYSQELAYNIYMTAVEKSVELAKERGSYPAWKNAELPLLNELMQEPKNDYEDNLRSNILNYGLRNGSLLAIAPNTSTSVLLGCSSSFLPVFNKFFIDKNSKGSVPVFAKYLSPETFWYYQENKNLDQQHIINITSALQQWTDQGISMEWYIDVNRVEAIDFYNLYMNAWKQKCKTVYYIRQLKLKKEECISCAN